MRSDRSKQVRERLTVKKQTDSAASRSPQSPRQTEATLADNLRSASPDASASASPIQNQPSGALSSSMRSPIRSRQHASASVVVAAVAIFAAVAAACSTTDLIVGEDTAATLPDGSSTSNTLGEQDGSPLPDTNDAGGNDAASKDASKDSAPAPNCAFPSTCLEKTEPCKGLGPNNGAGCGSATQICCAQTCPVLSPPSPTFCDGGPTAALYDTDGCVVGYQCAPIACTTGGGACVGLSPTSCPNGHFGDATKYSCGAGIGTACCLP